MQSIDQKISELLYKPMLAKELAQQLGEVDSTIWSALKRLQERGEIVKHGKGKNGSCIWIKSSRTINEPKKKILSMPWR